MVPEVATEQPSVVQTFLEKMSFAVEQGQDAVTYLKNEAVQFTRTQWEDLDRRFHEEIDLPDYLKLPVNRDAILAFTSSKLSSFREEVSSSIASISSPSPETKQTLMTRGIAVGGTLLAGGIAYGLYRLFRGAKKVGSQAVQKSKSWLRTILIGGVSAIGLTALYFHADKLSSMATSFVEGIREDAKKAAADKATEILEDGKKIVADAKKDISQSVVDAKKSVTTFVEGSSSEASDQLPPSESIQESAAAIGTLGVESIAGRFFSQFADQPDIHWPEGKSATDYQGAIIGVLNGFVAEKSLTMDRVFECMQLGRIDDAKILQIYKPPVAKDHPEYLGYLRSAELVIREFIRHRSVIATTSTSDVTKMNIKEFVGEIAAQNKVLLVLQDLIAKDGIENLTSDNFKEVIAALGVDSTVAAHFIESMKRHPLYSKLQQSVIQNSLKDFSLNKALSMITALEINPEITVSDTRKRLASISAKTDLTDDQKFAVIIVSVVLDNLPTEEELQPFFGGIFPSDSWVDPESGEKISSHNKKVIAKYLNDRMTFHEAARLFLYKKMIVNENPAGALFMLADMLRFSRKEEPGAFMGFFRTRMWRSIFRMGESAFDTRFLFELEKAFNLSSEMRKRIEKTIVTVAPTILKSVLKSSLVIAGAPLEPAVALAIEHPFIAGTGAVYLASKPIIALSDFRAARTDPKELVHVLEKRGRNNFRNRFTARLKMRYSPHTYHDAGSLLKEMNDDIAKLSLSDKFSVVGKRLDASLNKCIVGGASDADFIEFFDAVEHQTSVARAAGTRGDDLAIFESLENKSKSLTSSASAEARAAIRVTSHPFRGRILSHGIPGLIEILGIYAACRYDIPECSLYRNAAEEARDNDQTELADFYETSRQKKFYVDMPMNAGSGLALFFLQKKTAEISLAKTGSLFLRGAPTAARIGAVGTFGLALTVEALRAQGQHIWDSLQENLEDISVSEESLKQMPKVDIENKLTEYSEGERSWGQWYRHWSISPFVEGDTWQEFKEGDTWQELERESNGVRENHMDGYLFHRFLSMAREGDPLAMTMAHQIFNNDLTEKEGGTQIMQNYLTFCKQCLNHKYGTPNDIKKIMDKVGLERAFHDADLAAGLQMDIASCTKSLMACERLNKEAISLLEEMTALEEQMAASQADADKETMAKEHAEKTNQFEALNVEFMKNADVVQGYEMFTLEQSDGSEKSILDLAMKEDSSGYPIPPDLAQDIVPQIQAYGIAKSKILREVADPVTSYTTFIARAKEIYAQIEGVNRVTSKGMIWNYTPEHYDMLLSYAYLLDVHPEFDEQGTIRQKIWDLPGIHWEQHPGSHPYEKKFDEVRDVIRENIAYLDALHYKYAPAPKEKDSEVHQSLVVGQENSLERNTDSLLVTFADGKELELKGDPRIEKKFDTSAGTFICKPNTKNMFGELCAYSWFVIPTNEGKFHIHEKNEQGVSQPGEWRRMEAMKDISLKMKSGGNFFYPYYFFTVKIFKNDGKDISFEIPQDKLILGRFFADVEFQKRKSFVEYEWRDGKIEKVEKEDGHGYLMKFTSPLIHHIELSSPYTKVPNQKTIITIKEQPEESS